MNLKYSIILSVIVLTSCTIGTNPQTPMPPRPPVIDMPVVPISTGATSSGETQDKHYIVKFTNNEGFLSVPHGTGSKIIVHFDAEANKSLIATLSTPDDTMANIRITQIVLPDQKSDGPFGRDLKYTLTQTGKYILIIGENKMAEGPWSGQVELKLTLK
ncbi:hypothetical protein K2X92_02885 [Candidatus Gracilibacteria bacterium]|nr:hypothetical protein [Candidatus Gracilibacteria bacterium]